MCTIAPKLLLQMLSRFRTKHPEVRMQLTDGDAQLLEERLINLQIEAAIYCRPDREPDPRLNYLPLFKEQMMIVLPKAHRLSEQHSISGFGFGFLPRFSIVHDRIIARPLVDPEYWRNIHLVTVRDKPQSQIVGALIHEAMRPEWANEGDLPVNVRSSRGKLVSCNPSKHFWSAVGA
jgi:LysR family hydrogen peroxide-inducible transcriptional activator